MSNELPLAAVIRLIKSIDPSMRVSEKAADVLRNKLEFHGQEISKKAKIFALHAKRKTITDEDIELASKQP